MKLVEIKDVRPGQVWKDKTKYKVILENHYDDRTYIRTYDSSCKELKECDLDEYISNEALIGKLDITHRIENNRLIKIPRKEVNEDDIVCFDDETNRLAVVLKVSPITITPTLFDGDKLEISRKVSIIGILGVTHEFVNDREA